MQRFIVEPIPFNATRVTKDRGDYIRELGVAFDAVLKPVIDENPERIVRINAARMLAVACKSGATAHYPTVTAMLTNANTPTDVKHYVLVAAGNLLSAYDVYDYRSRRHSNAWKNDQQKGAGRQGAGRTRRCDREAHHRPQNHPEPRRRFQGAGGGR